jgi:hypothetical protein
LKTFRSKHYGNEQSINKPNREAEELLFLREQRTHHRLQGWSVVAPIHFFVRKNRTTQALKRLLEASTQTR